MKIAIWTSCLRILCFALLAAALPSASFGQWEADRYTSYTNDDTYIYTTVVVEGEVTAFQGLFLHTYSAYNMLGGVGGWTDSGDPTSDWVTLENDQQIDASDGSEYEFDSEAEVNCNYAGEIYDDASSYTFLSIHTTTYKYASVIDGGCVFNAYCVNTPQICGADSTTVQAPCAYDYFVTSWLLVRIGQYSTCWPNGGVLTNTWQACR